MALLLFAIIFLRPGMALAHDCHLMQAADIPGSAVIAAIGRRLAAEESAGQRSVLQRPVPNAEAFKGWKKDRDYVGEFADPFNFEPANFECEDETLYPTNPQMTLKEYHSPKVGTYDHFKLEAEDEACSIGSKFANSKGVKQCLSPHILKYVVISDTYTDSCGNLYRGFVERTYFKREENMATLFSEGRTAYEGRNAAGFADYDPGHTFPVKRSDFLLLTLPFPGDAEKVKRDRKQAEQAGYCQKDRIYFPKRDCP